MAKTAVVNRELKRRRAVRKYAAKRKALLVAILESELGHA